MPQYTNGSLRFSHSLLLLLFTIPSILGSNTSGAPSLAPTLFLTDPAIYESNITSVDDPSASMNCTTETTIDNVTVVQCYDYCGPNTWFSYEAPSSDIVSPGEAIWEFAVNTTSCQMDCGAGNTSVVYESVCNSNVTSSGFASRDVCQEYCDLDVPLFSECVDTTNITTTCRVNYPSPLVYTLSEATLLTIGNESALFIECPTGPVLSSQNCTCSITIEGAECNECSITSLSDDDIQYVFDCSNLITEACAIVSGDGTCLYNETESIVAPKNTSNLVAATTMTECETRVITEDNIPIEYFVCSDVCQPGSTFINYFQNVDQYYQYFDGSLYYYDSYSYPNSFLSCFRDGPQMDVTDLVLNGANSAQLCAITCNIQLPLYIPIDGTTTYRYNSPSPLRYRVADGRTLYIGYQSALTLNCDTGEAITVANCRSCDLFVRASSNSAYETCNSCIPTFLDDVDNSLVFAFDCSNIFPYDECAVVSGDARCINEQLGYSCSYEFDASLGTFEYTCLNYCGPDSSLTFTFTDPELGSPGANEAYIYDPDSVNSVCDLQCKGKLATSYDCAPNFAAGVIANRDICESECQIKVSPYVEWGRTESLIVYRYNSLSPLQKNVYCDEFGIDERILFLGEQSYLYLLCLRGEGISRSACICEISLQTDYENPANLCNSCDIGGFDDELRPVFGFDCTNFFSGYFAKTAPDGACENLPVSPPPPTPAPGKGKGKGKGDEGGMMMGMKGPSEPMTAMAMMASEKGKKGMKSGGYKYSTTSATYRQESDTPKGPMSSKNEQSET